RDRAGNSGVDERLHAAKAPSGQRTCLRRTGAQRKKAGQDHLAHALNIRAVANGAAGKAAAQLCPQRVSDDGVLDIAVAVRVDGSRKVRSVFRINVEVDEVAGPLKFRLEG